MAIIEIENLNFSYPDCPPALGGITLSVNAGEFVVLAGRSGSGKSTLLSCIKNETAPYGTRMGSVRYRGKETSALTPRESAAIGYVTQRTLPVASTVSDDVAFGVCNLGLSEAETAAALAETCARLGLGRLWDRGVSTLSGGEKKLVQLGGVLAMRPDVILLDEPTAQLDPAAAAGLIDALRRLNGNGLTVIMTSHRGDALDFADKLALLSDGKLVYYGRPDRAPDGGYLPTAARIYYAAGGTAPAPLSVRDFLGTPACAAAERAAKACAAGAWENAVKARGCSIGARGKEKPAVSLRDVRFAFSKTSPDVINGATAEFFAGGHYCLLGAVGSGKTTLLGVIGGIRKPYSGKVRVLGKPLSDYAGGRLYGTVSAVSQNPRFMFTETTVGKDLEASGGDVAAAIGMTGIEALCGRHPYDLSGGELQLAAMAKALAAKPRILLLDEPSKGLDRESAARVGRAIRELTRDGITVITATHDVDFAADYADYVSFVFDGRITPPSDVNGFFCANKWFTTDAARISAAAGGREASAERLASAVRVRAAAEAAAAEANEESARPIEAALDE